MVTVLESGAYRLIETKHDTKILALGDRTFAWIAAKDIGELLVASRVGHNGHILAAGNYRLYDVEDEPHLVDSQHLELNVGEGLWQGYLLLTGLPTAAKKRSRIIPTNEVISSSV